MHRKEIAMSNWFLVICVMAFSTAMLSVLISLAPSNEDFR